MKNLMIFCLLILSTFPLMSQAGNADQNVTATATLKSASRLFGAKDDLTSVIMVIPSGSVVNVLDSDSSFLHVSFEDNEGYIVKRDAVIYRLPVNTPQANQQEPPAGQTRVMSRYSFLESKYGSAIASKIQAGKIWKGMSTEMVTDSWGIAEKINRITSDNIPKEEWNYKNTWLYFENNILLGWGPVRK